MLSQDPAAEFCTATYAWIDYERTGARLTMSAGDHPLPLLLHADGTVEPVGRPGLLLGMQADPELSDYTLELYPGDALMLYTDGLTDAYAPDRTLHAQDLASVLASCAGRSASEIAHRIQHAALGDDTKQPRDHVALVVVRLTQEVADRSVVSPPA